MIITLLETVKLLSDNSPLFYDKLPKSMKLYRLLISLQVLCEIYVYIMVLIAQLVEHSPCKRNVQGSNWMDCIFFISPVTAGCCIDDDHLLNWEPYDSMSDTPHPDHDSEEK